MYWRLQKKSSWWPCLSVYVRVLFGVLECSLSVFVCLWNKTTTYIYLIDFSQKHTLSDASCKSKVGAESRPNWMQWQIANQLLASTTISFFSRTTKNKNCTTHCIFFSGFYVEYNMNQGCPIGQHITDAPQCRRAAPEVGSRSFGTAGRGVGWSHSCKMSQIW